jgi:hypothetical protein
MTIMAEEGSASGHGTVKGTYRLDLDAGQLLGASSDMTMDIRTDAGPGSSRAHSVITLLN